jgi:hypothetical protein
MQNPQNNGFARVFLTTSVKQTLSARGLGAHSAAATKEMLQTK